MLFRSVVLLIAAGPLADDSRKGAGPVILVSSGSPVRFRQAIFWIWVRADRITCGAVGKTGIRPAAHRQSNLMARSWLACIVVALSLGLCWVPADTPALKNGKTESIRISTPPRPPVLICPGVSFRVRTTDPIDVKVAQPGTKLRGAIDDPIMAGGEVIVPSSADVVSVAAKVIQGADSRVAT